jgi:oligopeptide transport system substrate-binding protein
VIKIKGGVFMKKRLILMFTLMFLLVMSVNSYSGLFFKKSKENKKIVKLSVEGEPSSLDPQVLTDGTSILIANEIYEGLTRLDPNGNPIPAGAKSWDINGNVWTFHLRENAKWSNGEPVTANDYYYGIRHGLEPEVAAPYSYMLYYIKNSEAYNTGEIKDFSQVGVKVIDDYTLEITLDKPVAYFPSVLAFPTYFPINEKFYKSQGDEFALEKENLIYNGPWEIKEWEHDSKIILTKNENFWDKDSIKIDELHVLMIQDVNTLANMYKNDEIDVINITGDQLPDFKGSKELVNLDDSFVWYLEFNTNNKYFKNENLRKAIAYAIDRNDLVTTVRKDGSKPARSFTPEGFPGKNKSFREDYGLNLFEENTEMAKKYYEMAKKELGFSEPLTLNLLIGSKPTAKGDAQFVQEQLRSKLGIQVNIENVTYQIRLQRMRQMDFDFQLTRWGADYFDPMTYMDLFVTGGGNNHTAWGNADYDKYIDIAYNTADKVKRMDAMAAAEKILLKEMPIVPLVFNAKNILIKSRVKNLTLSSVGAEKEFYWADIEE